MDTPVALTIGGSDCSGGAGIQADIKTFSSLGVYATSAITCVVAENPKEVKSIFPIPAEEVLSQIHSVMEVFPIKAIKTGMLYSQEIILALSNILKQRSDLLLVVDPVMVASSGGSLLEENALTSLKENLLPCATLVTPNRDEAEVLSSQKIENLETMRRVGEGLVKKFGTSFLMKGGHFEETACDILCTHEGKVIEFNAPRLEGSSWHGTGCTLSAGIAAGLSKGLSLEKSISQAKIFVRKAIEDSLLVGEFQLLNQVQSS